MAVIDYQKVNMTDAESEYYNQLVKQYSVDGKNGADYFRNLFETDDNGMITIIKPTKSVPWVVLFFIQNIMINQRLRENDNRILELEKRI